MIAKKKSSGKGAGGAAGNAQKGLKTHPDLAIVEDIIAIMEKAGLAEFKLERKGLSIGLRKSEVGMYHNVPVPVPAVPAATAATPATEQEIPKEEARNENIVPITSPMVGTFYRSPSPDADPYVETGNQVKPDTVVCIVEAMKLMNEIKAEVTGKIVKICIENGQPVEFGQELFLIEKSL